MIHTRMSVRKAFISALAIPFLAVAALAGGGGGGGAIAAPTVADSMGPLDLPGITIKNFGVVDGRIYRGGQPSKDEYSELARLGVKTVIDLRDDAGSDSQSLAESAGLTYVHLPLVDHGTPTMDQAAAFLKTVDAAQGPVYVHCAGGRHRTGSMIAVWRMTRDNWTLDQAYKEMLNYDFYTRNGHGGFKTFVEDYYKQLQAGQPTATVAADAK
jgi:uncharacterized protein (TIGR01244 family)